MARPTVGLVDDLFKPHNSSTRAGVTVMKKNVFSLWIAAAFLFIAAVQIPAQKSLSAEQVMQRAAEKLASVKVLGYKYKFEFRYPSQQRSLDVTAQAYLDLHPADGTADFKYQFLSDDRLSVYNGSESFIADKKTGKLLVQNKPSFDKDGSILLMNSPLTLKNALPRLIANTTIQKKLSVTNINGTDRYVIDFALPKAAINTIGQIYESRAEQAAIYRLTIDGGTFLPVEVLRTNDKNDESFKVSFSELTERPANPDDLSWYYSTYSKEYKLEKPENLELIKSGQKAPDLTLSRYGSGSQISLGQRSGKAVLLEFWIVNCGFCIAAVPKLNAIKEKFKDADFELISVNAGDSEKLIDFFTNKNKPEYTILKGDDAAAKSFGVSAYPSFVLIDKNGTVVYSMAGLEEKDLETWIVSAL